MSELTWKSKSKERKGSPRSAESEQMGEREREEKERIDEWTERKNGTERKKGRGQSIRNCWDGMRRDLEEGKKSSDFDGEEKGGGGRRSRKGRVLGLNNLQIFYKTEHSANEKSLRKINNK